VSALRTWKRSQRQAQHLTARERRLLAVYDEALQRADWRSPSVTITKPIPKERAI